MLKGDTLYFDPGSRRRTLKIYAKGQEIEANSEHQPALVDLPHARAWADNILRAELTLRSMELKRIGLDQAHHWRLWDALPFDPLQLLRDRLGTMTMTTTRTLTDDVLASLTSGQRMAYLAWVAGNDLRAILSNGAFYNLRKKLLPHGIDIGTAQPREAVSNVIPLVRVLEAKPAPIPDWANGTALYFEPRRTA
jgi:II/X family phage/plasmid replication protein